MPVPSYFAAEGRQTVLNGMGEQELLCACQHHAQEEVRQVPAVGCFRSENNITG